MARDGSGTFTMPAGSSAVTGQTIDSVDYNAVLADITSALNDVRIANLSDTSAWFKTLMDDADEAAFKATVNLEIGTDVQAYDADLAAIAGLTSAADKIPYYTGAGTAALADFTTFARTLVANASAADARTDLGLSIGSEVQAYDADLAAIAGLTSAADKIPYYTGAGTAALADFTSFGRTLVANASAADTLLDLGLDADLATFSVPASTTISTFAATILDDANQAAAQTTLGVVPGTDVQVYDANMISWPSTVDATEVGYLNGVTSAIQTQLNAKEAADADILKADTADTLTAGFSNTSYNAGTKSSGTYTPDPDNGNMQYATNNGAHTLGVPTNSCSLCIQYTNGASAGAVTTSSYTLVDGDDLSTTNGDDFLLYITKNNGFSHLTVKALQ